MLLVLQALLACNRGDLTGLLETNAQANLASPVALVEAQLFVDPTGIAGFAWLQTW